MKWIDKLSGKNVGKSISEYSEVYGEVILGIHRDVQTCLRRTEDYRDEIDSCRQDTKSLKQTVREQGLIVKSLQYDLASQNRRVTRLILGQLVIVLTLVSGIVIWILR